MGRELVLGGRHCTKRSQAQIPREGDVHPPPAASSSEYAMFWLSEMTLTTVVYFFFFEMFSTLWQITGKTVLDFLQDFSGAAVGEGRTF